MIVGSCPSCGASVHRNGMDLECNHSATCGDWENRRRYNEVPKSYQDQGLAGKYGWPIGDPRNEPDYWEKNK